jgi:aspartate/methionine/tyrosine aminotransferase
MNIEQAYTQQLRETYHQRLELAENILKSAGVVYARPDAAFYIFAKLPVADAEPFAQVLLEEKSVAVVPGSAFGPYPEFVRISLTETEERLAQGLTSFVEVLKAYA